MSFDQFQCKTKYSFPHTLLLQGLEHELDDFLDKNDCVFAQNSCDSRLVKYHRIESK